MRWRRRRQQVRRWHPAKHTSEVGPFQELGDSFYLTNQGDSVYHGGTLEIERRFGQGFGIHGSYTFSKTMVDFFNLFNRVNIRDLAAVYGSADLNIPPIAGFNTPRDVFIARQIQLALKLKF
jgi:hypothetical protein